MPEYWIAWLPAEKLGVFGAVHHELKISYNMLSVALNEAFDLRTEGSLLQACEEVDLAADLFDRLVAQVLLVLRALHEQGRNMPAVPNVTPLTPENFRSATGHRVSRSSNILSHFLFAGRRRFFSKLQALSETAEELALQFRESAEEVTEGGTVPPPLDWDLLDVLHDDMNTCLQESIIVLKSLVLLLPDDDLRAFHQKLMDASRHPAGASRSRFAAFRHRRATVI